VSAEEQEKRAQRSVAFEACQGIPTEALQPIAALPVTGPAALTEAAAKQAKKQR
jgi:hypothetical protein